jgi:uncharacterized protein YfkK (UPF0435 family)
MDKNRKTSHILNVFQFDANGHVVLPASLTLGIAPTGEDNSAKVPTTAWVRSIIGTTGASYVPTERTITINGTSYDLSSNRAWSIDTGVLTASAGSGISVSVVSQNLNIVNTGLLTATSGSGISVSTVNQNLNIVNTGILTASSGAGISLSVVNQNLNVVNTGILTASAGLGISLSVVNQNLNVINTGILTASAGSGISLSVVDQNLNVINTGVLTASAGAGISLSIVGGNLNVVNTITNNNQLTNGAGYITSSALTGYATETYVGTQISNLVDSSPATLDTLNELAAALGDDPNFATTVSTSIGTKVPQARTITINGTSYDLTANRSWTINSMVYPSAGIALSTGTAWGTSITDNSSNWNTAYGWGNHASAGYAASSHTHSIANVTGLQTALDGKQASGSYAASVHTHAISDVTGLQTALAGKQAQLNGTGFVKVSGTTVSYDNSTYLTTSSASSTYVRYTGSNSELNMGTNFVRAWGFTANGFPAINVSGTIDLRQNGGNFSGAQSLAVIGSRSANTLYFTLGDTNLKAVVLENSLLTDHRTFSFPDATGTLALTSDLGAYLPLTGGTVSGSILPTSDASYNLGSTSKRWNHVYTTDLHLSNEGKQNVVDGTWGDWTLQEGENDIFMLNNRSGEKFKIKLEKI